MKNKEKEEARELRLKGFSVREITKKLNVSKGSVSRWVRDISLSEDQKKRLARNISDNQKKGCLANSTKFLEKRRACQEQGIADALQHNKRHAMGCMLYWAEGYKKNNLNSVKISNSDPYMVKFFIEFLREFFQVKDEEITVYLNFFTDKYRVEEIENFWLNFLGLSKSCLRKSVVNNYSNYSLKKKTK